MDNHARPRSPGCPGGAAAAAAAGLVQPPGSASAWPPAAGLGYPILHHAQQAQALTLVLCAICAPGSPSRARPGSAHLWES